ncbi:ribonucleoside-diphosphate reductase beta chain [Paenisporosarcina quisquiliarum]|jgi:ribonucleoside-diphosphate reductase beta chain|uniref:Ribonucleoside-diphosphate reductase subunit beta n=1 Tax=Psychrobacillus psychrodurans TaxID=126157 RepID=A0A9X3LB70_9BACI|nr:ribonucleotide-diphosphate reductase subunit beta [Psychrobacillus psychrodurans]SEN77360.1 ribonucleoside-diphosphate reductase beta chain [Paenisporosarcina quisquiliarum]MCK1997117.1 ribonucleotide-diphosphate reductase subunit beta [Psychrobacillus psychrodurans]MCZ8534703.1 ribonucleotide-diphosphate reductase subunit beta [Psychrobacillus psychrodurans]MCZ8540731.1 ribonucleotide-diphosphate reductase subunit beta [Psychrobacillus psychrodurans]SFM74218.1 ribonucleoside-diphosphate re
MQKAKTLDPRNPNKSTGIFNGRSSGILNWNDIAYPHWHKMYKRLLGNYWQADEINMSNDIKQFASLSTSEQDAYLKIIGLLATLDAPQTRTALLLSLYATDSSVQSIMAVIAQQEAVHNESYSYVLSSIVSLDQQNKAFEFGRTDKILLKRNQNIAKYYNDFVENPTTENILKTLTYTTLLEGLFFYSGFAYFYNLARYNKMVGTSTMISYINRDELEHGRFISELFRATLSENPELNNEEMIEWVYEQYKESVELEIEWSQYVLADIEGINLEEMHGYIKYRANKMLRLIGLNEIYPEYVDNPMKWIRAYADNIDGTKTDFFEQKSRQYVKVNAIDNGFDDL